ncbi:phage Gp37/Gp68 family protein [Skermanella mucosa]|uniref:phage Gp37/Gp68 family protein n=1 Tax=Skermanella mucosa TaxID=1789672 RepID=UPI00192AB43D|nr:phage Gp37/Gp68 family protein [Skermanella mucosa]UEM23141.1 phage Gp37/Gp68 family protein [Skermanella mucosa]
MNTFTNDSQSTLQADEDHAQQHAEQEQTVSGNSSADEDASAEADSGFTDLEAGVLEHVDEVQLLIGDMDRHRLAGRTMKLDFESRMAVIATKFAPLYARISAMPPQERRAFLSTPAKLGGVEKKWPDARAIDPYAVMMVHKYLFDGKENRKGAIKVLCNRIGYTAAALAEIGKFNFDDAYNYVVKNGMCGRVSLDYTARKRNKYEVGLSVLDSKPVQFSFSIPEDDGFPPGSYRAFLVRKAEEAGYHLIDDLAPDEKLLGQIIERYYSYADKPETEHGEPPPEDPDIRTVTSQRLSIEWTGNRRVNPSGGCSNADADCDNCYARSFSARQQGMGRMKYEGTTRTGNNGRLEWTGRLNWDSKAARQPLHWGKGQLIFVNSMSDLGHPGIKPENFAEMLDVIEQTADRHVYQVLTKRPNVVAKRLKVLGRSWPDNAWLGTSVGVRKGLHRIAALQEIDAKRFLSLEPLIEDVGDLNLTGIDWVIAGGESGQSRIRKPEPDWLRNLRDQCLSGEIPFFFKQWGDWKFNPLTREYGLAKAKSMEEEVGDANSHGGALLDERLWREMPEKMAEVLRSS